LSAFSAGFLLLTTEFLRTTGFFPIEVVFADEDFTTPLAVLVALFAFAALPGAVPFL
jgi:hypothetical protein